jgi:hypothetical protein
MKSELKCVEIGRMKRKRELTFADLLTPIASKVRECHWLVSRDTILGRSAKGELMTEEELSSLIVRRSREWSLLKPAFGSKYSSFVGNDWCDIIALRGAYRRIGGIRVTRRFVERRAEVYFKCVDGVYWVAISANQNLIAVMKDWFTPSARDVRLSDLRSFFPAIASDSEPGRMVGRLPRVR